MLSPFFDSESNGEEKVQVSPKLFIIEPARVWLGSGSSLRIVPVRPVVEVFP